MELRRKRNETLEEYEARVERQGGHAARLEVFEGWRNANIVLVKFEDRMHEDVFGSQIETWLLFRCDCGTEFESWWIVADAIVRAGGLKNCGKKCGLRPRKIAGTGGGNKRRPGRPRKEGVPSLAVMVYMPLDVRDAVKEKAAEEDVSMSSWIVEAVGRRLFGG